MAQEFERRDGVAGEKVTGVHGAVGVADEFEDGG